MSQFVARSKSDKERMADNRTRQRVYESVPLGCGHEAKGVPALSNPDRWWCCNRWQRKKMR